MTGFEDREQIQHAYIKAMQVFCKVTSRNFFRVCAFAQMVYEMENSNDDSMDSDPARS